MGNIVEPRNYRRSDCAVFRKTNEEFGGLSNMASGFPLTINGVHIRTSEALYQACRFPHEPDVQRLIIDQRSPMTAKMKSKPHRKDTRADWERILTKIMRWCLRVKLAQNWEKFSALLLATGDRPIVEESRKDAFWGAKPVDDDKLVGANVLGRLLRELREDLRKGEIEKLRHVEPLDVPDLLLFGQPIGTIEASGDAVVPVSGAVAAAGESHTTFSLQPFGGASAAGDEEPSPSAPSQLNEERPQMVGGSSIPKECKRLAEVDFPIAVVSRHAAREKSIRHGHPSTLHLWWARRPLASCRAMLLALLFPDPCDEHCPEAFKDKVRELLPPVVGPVGPKDEDLRAKLLKFIGDFANWDLSTDANWISAARGLVKAAHPDEPPLVADPFAGGGSIPLEALRLGCDAFASDLNPVACLILKVMLEDIPRHGPDLADEVRRIGNEITKSARNELTEFYPHDLDGARPIAYLWAKTVQCEAPNCGAEIPLMRSFWLSKKANRKRALKPHVLRSRIRPPRIEFEIFEPTTDADVLRSTVTRARARCLCCGAVLPPDRTRAQLATQHGGSNVIFDEEGARVGGARLLAVVILKDGQPGRQYRLPEDRDYGPIWRATKSMLRIAGTHEPGAPSLIPDEPTPPGGGRGAGRAFPLRTYGMTKWGDLFTFRQNLALMTIGRRLGQCNLRPLVLALGKLVDLANSICRWEPVAECPRNVFAAGRVKPAWDFAEGVPISESSGSLSVCIENLANGIESVGHMPQSGNIEVAAAQRSPLPDNSVQVWFTDPPYYDAYPYADLSDAFFVWLKRALSAEPILRDPYDSSNPLTPKDDEAIQDESRMVEGVAKDRAFFERAMADAFSEGRRNIQETGIGCIIFAHKTTEGWEALISGIIGGGLTVVASWPIATEQRHRLRAQNSAALETSVHLVCRPRAENASVGDWAEVLRELPKRVGNWMERLQSEEVRGADLVFACIGPALELFSRYSKVETAEGREVGLPEYLEKVWEVVGRTALEQILGTAETKARNGLAGALEEDARLSALFLWTLQSTNGGSDANGADDSSEEEEDEAPRGKSKGYSLIYDVVRRFAQPLGIHLPDWEGRIIEMSKGVVRLMAVTERSKQLFGEPGAGALADEIEASPLAAAQLTLFPEEGPIVRGRGRRRGRAATVAAGELETPLEATTLDRVHAAMLLQASGRSQALRNLLKAEQERGPDFLRLANALSALYPRRSEEKRLLDAMLLAVPR